MKTKNVKSHSLQTLTEKLGTKKAAGDRQSFAGSSKGLTSA